MVRHPGNGTGPLRVVVAMSGGVDSSTVAARLVAQGHEVIGMTMRLWTGGTGRCCGMDDVHDARRVAATLGIPFYVVDLEQAFRRAVVDEFCHSYGRGETPSPCIRCNQFIKFDLLLQRARELGAVLATGHYVVRRAVGERFELWRARDPQKDQSYFLFTLTQSQLADLLFPLGDSFKHETRSMAASHGLHISDKRDSQDICFVPSDGGPRPDYRRFIDQYLPGTLREGEIVEQGSGRVLGHHRGIAGYTIGQRHGLGISTGPEPWYVLALDVPANRLIVGRAAALYRDTLHVRQLHWIAGHAPVLGTPIQARIRYAAEPQPAKVIPLHDPDTPDDAPSACVRFAQPQRAITPGQACVFYTGDQVLGGGWIMDHAS